VPAAAQLGLEAGLRQAARQRPGQPPRQALRQVWRQQRCFRQRHGREAVEPFRVDAPARPTAAQAWRGLPRIVARSMILASLGHGNQPRNGRQGCGGAKPAQRLIRASRTTCVGRPSSRPLPGAGRRSCSERWAECSGRHCLHDSTRQTGQDELPGKLWHGWAWLWWPAARTAGCEGCGCRRRGRPPTAGQICRRACGSRCMRGGFYVSGYFVMVYGRWLCKSGGPSEKGGVPLHGAGRGRFPGMQWWLLPGLWGFVKKFKQLWCSRPDNLGNTTPPRHRC
jgi:hypothetical protein